jgi:signal transduction histidine kinase
MRLGDWLHDSVILVVSSLAGLALFGLAVRLATGPGGEPPARGDWLYAAALAGLCLLGGWALDWARRRRYLRALAGAAEQARRSRGPDAPPGLDLGAQDPDLPPVGTRGTAAIVSRALEALESARRAEREAWRRERQALADSPAAWIHELKTPVSALRLILESRDPAGADLDRLLPGIEEEVDRLESLLEEALFEARAESFDRDCLISEVDVRRLAAEAAALLSRSFMAAGVSFSMDAFSLRALSDPKWLSFVLRQILGNAVKYTPRGGGVRVSARRTADGEALVISDTGPGIDAADLPRVFDRGFTGAAGRGPSASRDGTPSAAARSTGLGLYLCRRLCEKLGHGLAAASGPGEGSAFVITFRRHTDYLDPAASLSKT